MVLERMYDTSSSLTVDQQCGTVAYWQNLSNQVQNQVSYYNIPGGNGANKFTNKVRLRIYASSLQFPNPGLYAYTQRVAPNSYNSEIYLHKNSDTTREANDLSHELGHAWEIWTEAIAGDSTKPYMDKFRRFWSLQVSDPPVAFNPNNVVPPWVNNAPNESFADAFRYFLGADNARGYYMSTPSGIKNPLNNPQWKKQLQLIPELTGYWDSYGLLATSDTLSWQGGTTGYWQFMNSAGKWIAQTNYYEYYEWNGSAWNRIYPSYNVH